jgi:hypothetical protein
VNTCGRSGGKKHGVARTQLAALAADLGARAPLDHVADLLDAGMRVRQRTLALLDLAQPTTSFCAPTVSRPMMRRFTVPTWLAGWYPATSAARTK